MKVQKKVETILVILLLNVVCSSQLLGQISLTAPPNDYSEEIQLIFDLYPLSIQVPLEKVNAFVEAAISDLEYDPLLPSPNASLSNVSPLDFTLNWVDSYLANQYRVSILDLGNGIEDFQVINAPPFSNDFLGNGPTLVVIQGETTNSSQLKFIVIDKIIMYEVIEEFKCSCNKPTHATNNVDSKSYFPTMRSFTLNGAICSKSQFQLNVELITEEDSITYDFSWEIDQVGRQINLGRVDCSDLLKINYVPDQGYPGSFITEDERLILRMSIDDNVLILQAAESGIVISDVDLTICCEKKKALKNTNNLSGSVLGRSEFVSNLSIAPNPSTGDVFVDFYLSESQSVAIQLLSAQGVVLTEWQQEELDKGNHQMSLDVDTYPQGVYYLQLKLPSGRHLQKIVLLK